MCRCSPYSSGRCVSHPWGHQSGRESSSSQGHTWEGERRHTVCCICQMSANMWFWLYSDPTHPTKKQKRQNSVFMSPTSWEMRVTMACWQCGHTVCTGEVWNISPCSTVTVVVPAWPPMWTNWPGVGPICPAIRWGKWPGGGGYIPPVDQRIVHIQNLRSTCKPQQEFSWQTIYLTWWRHGHGHGHGSFSWNMWGNKAWLLSFIWWRTIIWRKRWSGDRSSSHWFTKVKKKSISERLKSSFH